MNEDLPELEDLVKKIVKEWLGIENVDERRLEERLKKLEKDEVSFLERNKNKPFVLSKKFYDAVVKELYEGFRWGEERGMILFREEERDEIVFGRKFYSNDWLYENKVIGPTPLRAVTKDKEGKPMFILSLGFDMEKLIELAEDEGSFPYICHTHPLEVYPSDPDLENYINVIAGFESPSKSLKKIADKIFFSMPPYKEITWSEFMERINKKNNRVRINVCITKGKPYNIKTIVYIPHKLPDDFLEEMKKSQPTVKLFYVVDDKTKEVDFILR